jgi:hypothetical protein
LEDKFISELIDRIHEFSSHFKMNEISLLIAQIDDSIQTEMREMTRFSNFVSSELKRLIFLESEEQENNNVQIANDNYSANKGSSITQIPAQTTQKQLIKNKQSESSDIDLDELVEYIKADDKKPKKKKKKCTNKKRSNNKIVEVSNEPDKEVESFIKNLAENSIKCKNIKKIKPNISNEWIRNLSNFDY